MSTFNIWPPRENRGAPSANNKIIRAIEAVARIEDCNKPVFRVVWGQDHPHCLRYLVNIVTKTKLGNPILNSQGRIEKLGAVYETGDPAAPPGAIVLEQRIIIGPPRWIIEYAEPVTEAQWESVRYKEIVPGDPFTRIDIRGPYPSDGLLYTVVGGGNHGMILMRKEHPSWCKQPNGPESFGCCYGMYREPGWRDLDAVQAIWHAVRVERAKEGGEYGFREEADSYHQSWGVASDRNDVWRDARKEQERVIDEAAQILTPYTLDRLVRGGDGVPADMQRFHDMGSSTTSARDNQARRNKHASTRNNTAA